MVDLKGWNFRAQDGFSGSTGKSAVKGYMRGGHVKAEGYHKAAKVPFKAARHETKHHGHVPHTEHQHKHNHGGRAKLHSGHSTPHPFARGGKVHRSEEHKDYREYNAPHDEAEYPEVSDHGRPAGYKKGGHHKHHYAKGGEVQKGVGSYQHDTLRDPHLSEPFEAAKRGGRIVRKAKGGSVEGHSRASHAHMLAKRHETHHHGHVPRKEHHHKHDHSGRAKMRSGHSTPHAYAMGGRAMPGPVMGAKHRAKVPMVSAARSPLATASPPAMGGGMGMGLKRGGRA